MSLPVEFIPLGGVNQYDNYARLGDGEVEDARNILFERKQCFNRPGVASIGMTGVAGPAVFGENVVDNAVAYNVIIGASSRIFIYLPGTEITPSGGAAAFGANVYNNACSVIGLVVLGNNPGGIVLWDPAGTTYSLVAGAPYRYVCGHQGRAIAAYRLTGGSTLVNARTFAWSSPGDLTDWLESDGSAGELAIAECNDDITGLGVLHNIPVILRRFGIHLAYPTGTLPLPYNIQSFILKGEGCFWPSTAAWSDEIVAMVGEDDVYMFDLQKLTPIGRNIKNSLLTLLNNGVNYRGFFTHYTFGNQPRYRYNLFPISSPSSPHYIYDIEEGKWSLHDYVNLGTWAWNMAPLSNQTSYGPSFMDNSNPPTLRWWNTAAVCERESYLIRSLGIVDAIEKDFKINDILIRTLDSGNFALTVTISATLNNTLTSGTATRTVGSGSPTGRWLRQWMSRGTTSLQVVGNDFKITVFIPASSHFACDYIGLDVKPDSSGAYRGY